MNSTGIEAVLIDLDYTKDLWKWIVYVFQGVIMVSTNGILFMVFARYGALQREKEYIFIAGLALGDGLNGLAYLTAGVHRIVLTLIGNYNDKVTGWDCMMTVNNFIFVFSDPMATSMLLVISIDRILSGVFLIRYISWGRRYAFAFVAVSYAYSLLFGIWAIVASYQTDTGRIYPFACYLWMSSPVLKHEFTAGTACCTASVAGYFIVWLLYKRYYKKTQTSTWQRDIQQRAKKQRRMTVSMAISNLFTFFLNVIPYGIITFINANMPNNDLRNLIIVILSILYNVNPMLNVIIYMVRHKEIQVGIKALCSCKSMPATVQAWPVGVSPNHA